MAKALLSDNGLRTALRDAKAKGKIIKRVDFGGLFQIAKPSVYIGWRFRFTYTNSSRPGKVRV